MGAAHPRSARSDVSPPRAASHARSAPHARRAAADPRRHSSSSGEAKRMRVLDVRSAVARVDVLVVVALHQTFGRVQGEQRLQHQNVARGAPRGRAATSPLSRNRRRPRRDSTSAERSRRSAPWRGRRRARRTAPRPRAATASLSRARRGRRRGPAARARPRRAGAPRRAAGACSPLIGPRRRGPRRGGPRPRRRRPPSRPRRSPPLRSRRRGRAAGAGAGAAASTRSVRAVGAASLLLSARLDGGIIIS